MLNLCLSVGLEGGRSEKQLTAPACHSHQSSIALSSMCFFIRALAEISIATSRLPLEVFNWPWHPDREVQVTDANEGTEKKCPCVSDVFLFSINQERQLHPPTMQTIHGQSIVPFPSAHAINQTKNQTPTKSPSSCPSPPLRHKRQGQMP